jgi:multidrug efflux pump subunit AcrB
VRGLIDWFARNGVAANLMMIVIIVAGLFTSFHLRREIFPEVASDIISISVIYPGASPEEVEEAVVVRIEERIQDLPGVKKIRSTSAEGVGSVTVEVDEENRTRDLLNDIKSRVDAIDTFPDEVEEPVVSEIVIRERVIAVAISGDADEATLKRIGERVRDELGALPGITQVELSGTRPYEISIEVSEENLQRFGLTFDAVASSVRRSSLNLPGGSIETEGGEILLRTRGQAYTGDEFEQLVLMTRPDGTRVHLGDVARIVDGFADTDQQSRFDGNPAVLALVYRVGSQDATDIADKVKAYVADAQSRMPEGIHLTTWQDYSEILKSRLELLVRNGRMGLILVFLVLALFLKLRLAVWVALGIPVSFLGAIALLPWFDISINLLSLFAFLLVLGIVVDDAIVVGENIYRHHQDGKEGLDAAVDGAHEVAVPVVFSILTTVAAFSPLLMVGGTAGKFIFVVPVIVISVIAFSLVESLLVLPTHLSRLYHEKETIRSGVLGWWPRFREKFSDSLTALIENYYRPHLEKALEWRYLTFAGGLALLVITIGFVSGGWIRFTFMPSVEADYVVALVEMPSGVSAEKTAEAVRRLEQTALELQREIEREEGAKVFRHIHTSIGEQPYRTEQTQNAGHGIGTSFSGQHLGEVNIELIPSEERDVTSAEVERRWRRMTGAIPDVVSLSFSSSLFSSGEPINVQLVGHDLEQLRAAAAELKAELAQYPGVFDVSDSFREGKEEIVIDITPEGEAMGLTRLALGRQVRQAFYGEEAQRIQRGRDDVRVMVRYPEAERTSVEALESMRVRTPAGAEIPFSVAGTAEIDRGYASITRVDRRRALNVTADVDETRANATEILNTLERSFLPALVSRYPGLRYEYEGEQKEQRDTLRQLQVGFSFALIVIYALLAIPFRSYVQPLIVMSAIPFGVIGAVWGHVIMGSGLTVLSYFGIVALTGVVVNDSLVLVDFINRRYRGGMPLQQAIREAGVVRFRPILLTSLTTFVGLLPLLMERSVQAQFLIPMATSLAFGVLFTTLVILIIVPVAYLILEDIRGVILRVLRRTGDAERRPVEAG